MYERRRSSKKKNIEEKPRGCFNCKLHPKIVNASNRVEVICENPLFERSIIVLILLNTTFLASEHYN